METMPTDFKDQLQRYLITRTDFLKVKDSLGEDRLREFVDNAIVELCTEKNIRIELDQRANLIRTIVSAVASLGPLRPLMEDPSISEIMINGAHKIYIQRDGKIELTDVKFDNNNHLLHTIQKILAASGSNKRVDESCPYVDFCLTDGSRVNVIIPPCTIIGPVVTIRKFNDKINTVDDVLALGEIDKNIAILLVAAMKAKLNVVFCGSTGAGKTTLMNVFSRYIPSEERIVTIEDTPELELVQENVVNLCSKPANIEGKGEISLEELFRNSLRMRPDRIIIGEVRGKEILDLVQSISSGHSGSLSIVHAESPDDCFSRMIAMMMMSGIQLSTDEMRRQIAKAIDVIIHVELFMDGKRRVTAVTDLRYDKATDKITLENIFEFVYEGKNEKGEFKGHWDMNKKKPSFYHKFEKRLVNFPEGFFV